MEIIENDKMRALELAPETMGKICHHVASGGNLIDLAQVWGVPHYRIMKWINENKNRSDQFKNALELKVLYTVDAIMRELQNLSFVDIGKAYGKNNELLDVNEMPEEVRRSIVAVETEELWQGVGQDREMVGYTKRIKLSDKLKSLETLGRRFALWIDRVKANDKGVTLEELIDATVNGEPGETE